MSFDANKIKLFRHVDRSVHPQDEMFLTSKLVLPGLGEAFHFYFYSGGNLSTRLVDWLCHQGKIPKNMSILDFACGYGRFTRYFSILFNKVYASDLEDSMLDFVKEKFGVSTFKSSIESSNFKLPQESFDIVFCYSLFTHLNPNIWKNWFEVLINLVAEDGYFVITTRSPQFAKLKGDDLTGFDGILFSPKNETRGRLQPEIYGQTSVDKKYVEMIASSVGGNQYVEYFPGGSFDLYQDVHIFRKTI